MLSSKSGKTASTFVVGMRQLTILLFTLVISFQAFYNVGVTVYWLANRTFIATNLCENRNDPKKHCEGKCYLNKKISETPDNAPANSERKSSNLKKGIELADIALSLIHI